MEAFARGGIFGAEPLSRYDADLKRLIFQPQGG